jgi:hypothetical protein
MGANEQEVQKHIAEARAALEEVRVSLHTGRVVRLCGLIAAIGIAVAFAAGFRNTVVRAVQNPEQLETAVKEQVKLMQLNRAARTIADRAGPDYWAEIEKLYAEMRLKDVVVEQLRLAYEGLRPVVGAHLARVRPEIVQALQAEGRQTLDELEGELQAVLQERLEQMVKEQVAAVREGTDVTEEQVEMILASMIEANEQALMNAIEPRWQEGEQELEQVAALAEALPELPPLPESALLDELGRVILALLRYELPEYEFGDLSIPPAAGPPPVATQSLVRWESIPEEHREQVRRALERVGGRPLDLKEEDIDWDSIPPERREQVRKALGIGE